jgi:hypothetical protein
MSVSSVGVMGFGLREGLKRCLRGMACGPLESAGTVPAFFLLEATSVQLALVQFVLRNLQGIAARIRDAR